MDSAIKELLKSLEQTNNPVQEVFSNRSVVGIRKRTSVFKEVSAGHLNQKVRDVLLGEGIIYADQLADLDLETIKKKYGLGEQTLSQLVRIILKYDVYKDLRQLHELILKYKLDTQPSGRSTRF